MLIPSCKNKKDNYRLDTRQVTDLKSILACGKSTIVVTFSQNTTTDVISGPYCN